MWVMRGKLSGNEYRNYWRETTFFRPLYSVYALCLWLPRKGYYSRLLHDVEKTFDLGDLEKRMQGIALQPIEKCSKGVLWIGAKKYLLNNNN